VEFRAHGGSDDGANLVAICAFHHLRAIHGGYMRVRGIAPDALVWTVRGRAFTAGAGPDAAGDGAAAMRAA
jgi:hypothetical protein